MSALFPDIPAAVAALKADRLSMMAGTLLGESFAPTDAYLAGKLAAAEADAERRLRVSFSPVHVFAGEPTEAEIAALNGARWVEESGYDFEPNLWNMEDWGYLVLRRKPVVRVVSMQMVYPTPQHATFTIPLDWIRLDKTAGHIRILPGSPNLTGGVVGMTMLSAMAAGRNIPDMIRIRYVAGLSNVAEQWPDLLDLVKKMAVLRVVQDAYLPSSGSISADGLSESMSVDMQAYHDGVDSAIDIIMDAMHGPRMIVL